MHLHKFQLNDPNLLHMYTKISLLIVVDDKFWRICSKITNTTELRKLAVTGLKIPGHTIDSHLQNNSRDIASATYEVLKEWANSKDTKEVAYRELIEALGRDGVDLASLRN